LMVPQLLLLLLLMLWLLLLVESAPGLLVTVARKCSHAAKRCCVVWRKMLLLLLRAAALPAEMHPRLVPSTSRTMGFRDASESAAGLLETGVRCRPQLSDVCVSWRLASAATLPLICLYRTLESCNCTCVCFAGTSVPKRPAQRTWQRPGVVWAGAGGLERFAEVLCMVHTSKGYLYP
jgi:hypothetical protein